MKMSAPKGIIFLISLILAGAGIVSYFTKIPFVSDNRFWFTAAGYIVLMLGCLFKGL